MEMCCTVILNLWKTTKTVLLLVSREDSKMMIFMFVSIIRQRSTSSTSIKSLEVLGLHDWHWQDFICLD